MRLSAAKHHRLSEVNSPRKLFRVSAAALAFSQNSAPAGHVMLTRPLRDPRASADVGDAEESSSSRSPRTLRPWVVLTSGWGEQRSSGALAGMTDGRRALALGSHRLALLPIARASDLLCG
ncbi:hypothetical protein R6Z07M_018038 [Ovis aries]